MEAEWWGGAPEVAGALASLRGGDQVVAGLEVTERLHEGGGDAHPPETEVVEVEEGYR